MKVHGGVRATLETKSGLLLVLGERRIVLCFFVLENINGFRSYRRSSSVQYQERYNRDGDGRDREYRDFFREFQFFPAGSWTDWD